MSLAVSLAGLAYGAFVAQKSVELWKTRYRHLRRVIFKELTGDEEVDNQAGGEISIDDAVAYFQDITQQYEEIMENERQAKNLGRQHYDEGTKRRARRSQRGSVLIRTAKRAAEVVEQQHQGHQMQRPIAQTPAARNYMNNTSLTTQSESPGVTEAEDENDPVHSIGLTVNVTDMLKTLPLLKKDAEEAYIFRQEYMQQLTYTWSLFIFLLVFVSFVQLAITLLTVKIEPGAAFTIAVNCLINLLLYIIPLSSIAYANEGVKSLEELVRKSGMDDYKAIGGRSLWYNHIRDVKSYWCVMSFPVTYDVIVGSMVTCLTGVAYVYAQQALTVILS